MALLDAGNQFMHHLEPHAATSMYIVAPAHQLPCILWNPAGFLCMLQSPCSHCHVLNLGTDFHASCVKTRGPLSSTLWNAGHVRHMHIGICHGEDGERRRRKRTKEGEEVEELEEHDDICRVR
jgi:hypothetical protein